MQQCQLYNDIVRSVSLGKRSPRSQPPLDGATKRPLGGALCGSNDSVKVPRL